MSTSVSWPAIGGTSYSIPAAGELNWQALSTFLIAIGNKAQSTDNTKLSIRTALTSPVTVAAASDCVVITKLSVPAAVLVNLPAGILGQAFFIVDGTGDASSNNVTIDPNGAETINGSATYVINKDRAGVLIGFNGTSWTILAEYTNIAAGTIPRSSIALGSANQVVINSGTGALSSEAQLAKSRGGTGIDNSSVTFPSTGIVVTEAGAETLTNKTIDGDNNTVQDLGITTLKTVIGNATKFLSFDGSGAPVATKAVPTGVVLGTTDVQAITLKDIDGGTASNTTRITVPSGTLAALTALTRKAGTIVYATDTKLEYLDDGTQLKPIGSGSGAGLKNYILNPNDANSGWFASGAGVTVATSTSASRPDNSTQPNSIVITRVSGTTAYAGYQFTLDTANYNWLCGILWDQSYAGTAGDYVLQLWSNTASNYGGSYTQITLPTSNIPSATNPFNTTALSPGNGNQYMELRIVATAGTTPLYLNNVTFTPGSPSQGAAIVDLGDIGATFSGYSGFANFKAQYYRSGNLLKGTVYWTSVSSSAATAGIVLPSGYSIDYSKLSTQSNGQVVGKWFSNNTVPTAVINASLAGVLFVDGSTTNTLYITNTEGASVNVYTKVNASTISNALMSIDFEVPISQWAGSGTVNLGPGAQVEYASTSGTWDAASSTTVYGPAGTLISGALTASRNKTITWQYPVQVSDEIVLQFLDTTAGATWQDASLVAPFVVQGAIVYGARIISSSSTSTGIQFCQYKNSNNATYAGAGSAWANDTYWRLIKRTASAPVGFGLATATQSGLYTAGAAPGGVSGSAVAAGNIGEVVIGSFSNYTLTTSEADVTGATLTVTAGIWRIFVSGNLDMATGALLSNAVTGTIKITDSSNVQKGNTSGIFVKTTAAVSNEITAPAVTEAIVYTNVSATYKLRAFRTDNNGTNSGILQGTAVSVLGSTFYAVRIA